MEPLSIAAAGLASANGQFERAAKGVIRAATPLTVAGEGAAVDVVDLSAAIVSLLEAKTAVETNVRLFQTAEEMSRTVLDVLA